MTTSTTKTCKRCEQTLPLSAFYSSQPHASYCKQCTSKYATVWTQANRKRKLEINEAWRRKNHERLKEAMRVHLIVWSAIKLGHLIRPTVCEECKRTAKPQAAHSDYSKPLEVRWLCQSCHRLWDAADPKTVPL